ncbi:FecR domain-containing protein [Pseudomonas sp. CFBP 8770]|uniref:FecR domain-containing protein n=1 Tax=unclassified Pseudomonas TaxID=196821 RepID=UPI0017832B08|nr:FecR domain-containing protein [Pseudomonas sp. CFBP 8773]MBD8647842.1 FecR domain-containing protein [Pseudomonas sp. CFBP 8770]
MSTPCSLVSPQILDAAIDWSLKISFNTADAATHDAFQRWLAADARHALAWQRLQGLNQPFARLPASTAMSALNRLPTERLQRRQLLKLLVLGSCTAAIGCGTQRYAPWQRLLANYSTHTGEYRRWTLPSGTLLELNTDSAVKTDVEGAQRFTLLRGEISATTGGSGTPLQLTTPHCRVNALHARFEARLFGDHTCLTVAEGTVSLEASAGHAALEMLAGEQWLVSQSAARRTPGPDSDHGAWRDGMLIVRNLPLARVLGELSRYRVGYLNWEQRVAALPVSGNFSTLHADQSVALIARAHGLHVRKITRYWSHVGKAA